MNIDKLEVSSDCETRDILPLVYSPLLARHIPCIAEIEREAFSEPWTEKDIASFLCNDASFFAVAELDGLPVGYGSFYVAADEGSINNIAVSKALRGRGVGRFILDILKENAEKRGLTALFLEARTSNTAALSLYASGGFTKTGIRKGFYPPHGAFPREDAVLMRYDVHS